MKKKTDQKRGKKKNQKRKNDGNEKLMAKECGNSIKTTKATHCKTAEMKANKGLAPLSGTKWRTAH